MVIFAVLLYGMVCESYSESCWLNQQKHMTAQQETVLLWCINDLRMSGSVCDFVRWLLMSPSPFCVDFSDSLMFLHRFPGNSNQWSLFFSLSCWKHSSMLATAMHNSSRQIILWDNNAESESEQLVTCNYTAAVRGGYQQLHSSPPQDQCSRQNLIKQML